MKIELKMIDCGSYVYIKIENIARSRVNNCSFSNIDELLFDGKEAIKTNKANWYKLDVCLKSIQLKSCLEKKNGRYELKKGYVPTDLMPKTITIDQHESDEYEEVAGLYEYVYDEIDKGPIDVEFEITTIYNRDNFEFVPNTYNASSDLLTQIEYPEEAYQDKPCKLDSTQMFNIIRNYVKKHIDTSVASITSDYEFHFEVKKKINLANPYTKLVDTNNSAFNRRRKPKWVERNISSKSESILSIKDKPSSTDYGEDCVVAPEIIGENYNDLEQKLNTYLEDLMKTINKKYCECPNCNGWGILEEK